MSLLFLCSRDRKFIPHYRGIVLCHHCSEHKILSAERSVKEAEERAPEGQKEIARAKAERLPEHALYLRPKGAKGPEGCELEGRLKVKRIPGNFHINFVHDNMDFHNSLINASHTIEYLIFGAQPLEKPMDANKLKMHNFISEMESKAYKVSGTNSLQEAMYVSNHEDRTFEHFVQIVPTFNAVTGATTYRYTVTSAEHEDSDRFPSAKVSYQLSPMSAPVPRQPPATRSLLCAQCCRVQLLPPLASVDM
eukprot:SAG11_NODE_4479_length_1880_cov_1.913532_2_plen_250_part_00